MREFEETRLVELDAKRDQARTPAAIIYYIINDKLTLRAGVCCEDWFCGPFSLASAEIE